MGQRGGDVVSLNHLLPNFSAVPEWLGRTSEVGGQAVLRLLCAAQVGCTCLYKSRQ